MIQKELINKIVQILVNENFSLNKNEISNLMFSVEYEDYLIVNDRNSLKKIKFNFDYCRISSKIEKKFRSYTIL